jgi:peptide/nickel transport system permease protein
VARGTETVLIPEQRLERRPWVDALRSIGLFSRRKPLGAFGGFLILVMLFAATFADGRVIGRSEPLLAPYRYDEQSLTERLQGPSLRHPFGTDEVGRDMFSRVIYGARVSVVIGFSAVTIAAIISTLVGTVSGYFGGWLDTLMQRLVDIWISFPPLVLLITLVTVFAPRGSAEERAFWIILSLGILIAAGSSRVVRGAVISVRNNQYVEAARTLGASDLRIILRHIVPNILPVVIILSTVQLGAAILAEASISFLGYGIPPPFPAWGTMLSGKGILYMRAHPWLAFWPGLAIALAVYGFNMLGDALRDVLDPRLRGAAVRR